MHRHLLHWLWQLPKAAIKRVFTDLLRVLLLTNRPTRLARAGFVLPTTVLLVLMVVLTATALTYRSFTRSDQAITQREQKVIMNAATPAVDRAKAKIEFLFQQDPRFPSGVPASDILSDLMAAKEADGNAFVGYTGRIGPLVGGANDDPYTLPGETRVDINNDGILDNAWWFLSDIDGNGTTEANEQVLYSILVDDVGPRDRAFNEAGAVTIEDSDPSSKAKALVTRTGPLATTDATGQCKGALAEGGWQVVQQGDNSSLQKNFQINAFVANGNDANRTFETLEFQQSRIADRANKWGAWFRYDLEVFPGEPLNWNGAMHTDSSFFAVDDFRSHMISSHNSCLYSQESSVISLAERNLNGAPGINPQGAAGTSGLRDFQGQAVKGGIRDDDYDGNNSTIHVFDGDGVRPTTNNNLTINNDSVRNGKPSDIAVNPLTLFIQDETQHINPSTWSRDGNWAGQIFSTGERIINDEVARPFVDDFYRADNRWGPKPRYDSRDTAINLVEQPSTVTLGDDITGFPKLINEVDGLDGYWERQAIRSGLRLIMGQRLELGNANGWNLNPIPPATLEPAGATLVQGDPLYPAQTAKTALTTNAEIGGNNTGNHEYLQRRSLRDNLAAVQGMVVYHYQGGGTGSMSTNGEFPAACMAMTAHPGTPQSIINSRTFNTYPNATSVLRTDFLTGNGTNGWEFQFPADFDTEAEFGTAVTSGALGIALRNLAYFAGDPAGGAPSFKPVQDGNVHPAPYLSMWGDFSPLRRIYAEYIDASPSVAYDALSFADKATLHSAACTLSLLAYNLESEYGNVQSLLSSSKPFLDSETAGEPSIPAQLATGMGKVIAYMEDAANDDGGAMPALFNRLTPNNPLISRAWVDLNPTTEIPTVCPAGTDTAGFEADCDAGEFFAEFTATDWEIMLDEVTDASTDQITDIKALSGEIAAGVQTLRDRDLGFRQGPTTAAPPFDPDPTDTAVVWGVDAPQYTAPVEVIPIDAVAGTPARSFQFKTTCDPNIFPNVVTGGATAQEATALALLTCSGTSATAEVKYPSLFYLFPLASHTLSGAGDFAQPDGVAIDPATQAAEEYITNLYVNDVNPSTLNFAVVDPADIAADPRSTTLTTWTVPVGSAAAGTLTNPDTQPFAIAIGANIANVPFLDKGMFDGREHLNTRMLDVDIKAITTIKVKGVTDADFWLPANRENQAEGVFYAFREDAVREDEIVRPGNTAAANCDAVDTATNPRRFRIENVAACRMSVVPGTTAQDPPLTTPRLISLKPVDFVADPNRRAHGFRLRTADGTPSDFSGLNFGRQVGMTMVTDNSVFIQGDFNLHTTNGTRAGIVEEFTQTIWNKTLNNAFGNRFYDDRTTLNTDTFANLSTDHWRPVEILADSVGVLSASFRDGAVSDTFLKRWISGEGGASSSYMNQNRPRFTDVDRPISQWVQEDPTSIDVGTENAASPIWVDRNGTSYRRPTLAPTTVEAMYDFYTADNDWIKFDEENDRRANLQTANDPDNKTFVNAVFVSGIVPKRPNQSYGGLHNYPRFLETWRDRELHIAGSFIQLNFSTTAVGPYEHDAWESGNNPTNQQQLGYYYPPDRRWGYDVGLLYVPPAPAARRFVTIGAPRSEYYREIPADDPYIVNLRCARDDDGNQVLSENLRPATCPA